MTVELNPDSVVKTEVTTCHNSPHVTADDFEVDLVEELRRAEAWLVFNKDSGCIVDTDMVLISALKRAIVAENLIRENGYVYSYK